MYESSDSAALVRGFAESNPAVSVYWRDAAMIGGLFGSWYATDFSVDAPRSSLVRRTEDSGEFTGGDFSIFAEFLGQMVNYERFTKDKAQNASEDPDSLSNLADNTTVIGTNVATEAQK